MSAFEFTSTVHVLLVQCCHLSGLCRGLSLFLTLLTPPPPFPLPALKGLSGYLGLELRKLMGGVATGSGSQPAPNT